MKLLLSTNSNINRDGYTTVDNFAKFKDVVNNNADKITDIRINSYLLGLVCIYWMIDNHNAVFKKTNFCINLKSDSDCFILREMIKRYTKKEI